MTVHTLTQFITVPIRSIPQHLKPSPIASGRRDWELSLTLSILFHIVLLFAGSMALLKPAAYGVEAGSAGVDVYLVAALPDVAEQNQKGMVEEQKDAEKILQAEMIDQKLEAEGDMVATQQTGKIALPDSKKEDAFKGDGSSAVPGQDAITFFSAGSSAETISKAFMRNPAPVYPMECIERGEEGVVMLRVVVNEQGKPESVQIQQPSGVALLDESAVKSVRKWKFDPGRVGFMAYKSTLEIPIRFELKKAAKK